MVYSFCCSSENLLVFISDFWSLLPRATIRTSTLQSLVCSTLGPASPTMCQHIKHQYACGCIPYDESSWKFCQMHLKHGVGKFQCKNFTSMTAYFRILCPRCTKGKALQDKQATAEEERRRALERSWQKRSRQSRSRHPASMHFKRATVVLNTLIGSESLEIG